MHAHTTDSKSAVSWRSWTVARRWPLLAAVVLGLVALAARPTAAQPGCTSKYGYWNMGVVCTNDEGNNCITCPPWP